MTAPVALVALADDTRWEILARLGRRPASASALAADLPISRQAVVKHVEVLRAAGLVESEQRGREVVHHAVGARLSALARELELVAAHWETRLQRVKRLAEAQASTGGDQGDGHPAQQ